MSEHPPAICKSGCDRPSVPPKQQALRDNFSTFNNRLAQELNRNRKPEPLEPFSPLPLDMARKTTTKNKDFHPYRTPENPCNGREERSKNKIVPHKGEKKGIPKKRTGFFFSETVRGTGAVGTVFQEPKSEPEPSISVETVLRQKKALSKQEPSQAKTGTVRTVPSTNRNRTEPNWGQPALNNIVNASILIIYMRAVLTFGLPGLHS